MAGPIYLLAVLSIIYLHSTNGRSTDSLSPRYPAGKYPKTLDEVLMQASGGEKILRAAGMGSDNIFDGLDMILSREQYAALYGGPQERSPGDNKLVQLWPNGRIPYEIDYGFFTPERLTKIKQGMTTWEDLTCVTFRPATSSDINKVQITSSIGCFSALGMRKERQPQTLSLNYQGCFYQGTVEHELGHAIGLVHEHQRPERDYHLGVYESNVIPFYRDQLQAYRQGSVDKMGLDYDYYSVMHYGKTAFSYDGVTPTLYAYDRRGQRYLPKVTEDLGKVLGPSFIDVKLVNLMYNCNASCPPMPTCSADCFVDKHCRCVCKDDLPPVPCVNSLANCELWAQSGECWANQHYMEYFCRKSCKMCPTHGTIPPEQPHVDMPCEEDRRADCQALADLGDCETYRESMLHDCRKTCTRCSGTTHRPHTAVTRPSSGTTKPHAEPPCEDKRSDCQVLADRGDCDSSPGAMMAECRQTCTRCSGTTQTPVHLVCEDKRNDCQALAARGDCHSNREAMLYDCRKTCGGCSTDSGTSSACVDDDANCPAWAKANYCGYYAHIIPTCKKSCGACT